MEDFEIQIRPNADTKNADIEQRKRSVNKRSKKRQKRTLQGEWPDEKTRKLISMVEQRSVLWDSSSPHYRSPQPQVYIL